MLLIFLSSGLFLAWSLGANNAANVFGPAVGTKMVKFYTAAIITTVFVILGAVIEGAGASQTLGKLGSVNAFAGAFIIALSAAVTVTAMTKLGLPVSTSQAIVGGIIGWNFFSGSLTDLSSLSKIFSTWVICPILAAIFAFMLFHIAKFILDRAKIHLLTMDTYTRIGFVIAGAFGAYSLGANNIANAMGVFVPVSPFHDITVLGITLTNVEQLFLFGGIAIGIGVITYSYKVMKTVGNSIFKLSPVAGLIVVLSEAVVLFLFGSKALQQWLLSNGLPAIPLVPVSSSQAVVGAVLGIAIAKGAKNIKFDVLGKIALGWITTPVIACIIAFFSLFVMQNVFDQQVYKPVEYKVSSGVIEELSREGLDRKKLSKLEHSKFNNAKEIQSYCSTNNLFDSEGVSKICQYAQVDSLHIDQNLIVKIKKDDLTESQYHALTTLKGNRYIYSWQLYNDLAKTSEEWKLKSPTKLTKDYNNDIKKKIAELVNLFRIG